MVSACRISTVLAAEHADIVSVAMYQRTGQPPGTFRLATAAQALDRVIERLRR